MFQQKYELCYIIAKVFYVYVFLNAGKIGVFCVLSEMLI